MSFATRIADLATRMATECKALRTLINGNTADLSSLTTTAKSNLVAAINELDAEIAAVAAGAGAINDSASGSTNTWSAQKVAQEILAAKNALINGSSAALDTLQELAAALGNDANFAVTVSAGLANRIRFDAAQVLTAPQQAQACSNLGVGDPDMNFVTTFNAGLA